jgi:hypothetical protein
VPDSPALSTDMHHRQFFAKTKSTPVELPPAGKGTKGKVRQVVQTALASLQQPKVQMAALQALSYLAILPENRDDVLGGIHWWLACVVAHIENAQCARSAAGVMATCNGSSSSERKVPFVVLPALVGVQGLPLAECAVCVCSVCVCVCSVCVQCVCSVSLLWLLLWLLRGGPIQHSVCTRH